MSDTEEEKPTTLPDQAFVKLGAGRGLTKKTMVSLHDAGFGSKSALADLSERQMRDLEIPAAQKFRLRKLVEDLLVSRNDEPEVAPPKQETMEVASDVTSEAASAAKDSTEATSSGETKKESVPLIGKDTLLSKMLRPHEAVFGDKTKDGNFLQFLYANLLSLENMYRTDKNQSVGYLHHLHFLTLKLMQQYPVETVFKYDHLVRSKVDAGQVSWQDRSNIGLDDELVKEHFDEEHLQKWKKMRRQSAKNLTEAFKTDRCLLWNYSKDGNDCTSDQCKFEHTCLACGAKHTLIKCPTNTQSEKKERKKAMFKDAASPRHK